MNFFKWFSKNCLCDIFYVYQMKFHILIKPNLPILSMYIINYNFTWYLFAYSQAVMWQLS